ncbi:hypothetical protein BC826DRAFT_999297 [Russula brevipes]|nr:hypothetical protein BC826DRAFT_999297 [Russula brevipes]
MRQRYITLHRLGARRDYRWFISRDCDAAAPAPCQDHAKNKQTRLASCTSCNPNSVQHSPSSTSIEKCFHFVIAFLLFVSVPTCLAPGLARGRLDDLLNSLNCPLCLCNCARSQTVFTCFTIIQFCVMCYANMVSNCSRLPYGQVIGVFPSLKD